jgi:hypothetical protein
MKNQPFLFSNGSGRSMLCCRTSQPLTLEFGGPYQIDPWKIWLEDTQPRSLSTPTEGPAGEIIIECNPHLFRQNGAWYLGYNAGFHQGAGTPVVYHHVCLETDLALEEFGPLQFGAKSFSSCRIGPHFYSVQKTAVGDRLLRDGQPVTMQFAHQSIYRICPVFEREDVWLMTVSDGSVDRSWMVNAASLAATPVVNAAGDNVYKCSLLGSELAYTVKGPGPLRSIAIETLP